MVWQRPDGRSDLELRPISIELNLQKHCAGSALIKWGDTHVLCAATLEDSLPPHVKDPNGGWVSAEYSLLPGSTHRRARRERRSISGRTAEIQRLIGRSLRGALDLSQLQGHSLTIDCDVLQADGGTRCAAITGAYVAASIALNQLGYRPDPVVAVSFGIMHDQVLTDLCYIEDSQVDVDLNAVWCEAGLVEIQGTAERGVFSPMQLATMIERTQALGPKLFDLQHQALVKAGVAG